MIINIAANRRNKHEKGPGGKDSSGGALRMRWLALLVAPMLACAACHHTTSDGSVVFGKVVLAAEVDSNNAPTALANVFSPQQKTIYVVAEAKEIAPGTRLSANWSREGTVIQVSNEVTADKGYHDSNIEFHMNPGADGWQPGEYAVQIIANGQPGPSATFSVKQPK